MWWPGSYHSKGFVPAALIFLPLLLGFEAIGIAGLQREDMTTGRAHLSLAVFTFFLFSRYRKRLALSEKFQQLKERETDFSASESIIVQFEKIKKRFIANPLALDLIETFLWRFIQKPSSLLKQNKNTFLWLKKMMSAVVKDHYANAKLDKIENLLLEGVGQFGPEGFIEQLNLQELMALQRYFVQRDLAPLALLLLVGGSHLHLNPATQRFLVETAEGLVYRELMNVRSDHHQLERVVGKLSDLKSKTKCAMMAGMIEDQILHFSRDQVA